MSHPGAAGSDEARFLRDRSGAGAILNNGGGLMIIEKKSYEVGGTQSG